MNTPIGRDFKRSGRKTGLEFSFFGREFLIGLSIGLAVAVGLFVYQQRALQKIVAAAEAQAQPRPAAPRERRPDASTETTEEPGHDFKFYDMLPQQEVVIPENERDAAKAPPPSKPNSPIERPGTYVLQPGAYRNLEEAERLQAKLARLGVSASVQRVSIDTDVFHRVRVGPIADLGELNRIRGKLRAADIDAVLIRVGD
ncbi:MAG: SPOR domain-containing protein [Gammaproteobacteria bacterium]|nr:SPOR domain-containing protein [Gammaproteobacteria bacterium]